MSKSIFLLSNLLIGLCALKVNALPAGYSDHFYNGMRYGLFIPTDYDTTQNYPLVVYLHGCSDTTSWDLQWYHDPIQSDDPCFVLTPKSFKYVNGCDAWGTSWLGYYPEDMQNTIDIIYDLIDSHKIDTNRLYIYGSSMGGFGTLNVLAKEPGMFAAGVAICGGGNPTTASQVAQTPVWFFHGSADLSVPVSRSKNLYLAIINGGDTQARFTEYPGVGHNAWDYAMEEPAFYTWILAQKKGENHGFPDIPENLSGEEIDGQSIRIQWNSPTDDSNADNQIWYYNIYRDGIKINETDYVDTVYTDQGLSSATSYNYQVQAVNLFFGISGLTSSIELTTSVTGLNDNISGNMYFNIVPNPINQEAAIQINEEITGETLFEIFSISGKLIYSIKIADNTEEFRCNLNNLREGLYLAVFTNNSSRYFSKLMIDR